MTVPENERLARLRQLFEQAIACDSQERERLLDQCRRSEPRLFAELWALLEHDQKATSGRFLEAPIAERILRSHEPSQDGAPLPETSASEVAIREPNLHGREAASTSELMSMDAATREYFLNEGYELIDPIGAGGFGMVFRAKRCCDEQIVAIKILHPSSYDGSKWLERCKRESEVHKHLNHHCIVQFCRSGTLNDERPWIEMEYVPGIDLWRLATQTSGLPVDDACKIIHQIALALDYAHRVAAPIGPFVHRDVNPRNILVIGTAGHFRAKLADFGLMKNFEMAGRSGVTATGTCLGTLEYMMPEQILEGSKYSGPEVDLYALGATLYFALCGKSRYDFGGHPEGSVIINHILERKVVPLSARVSVPDQVVRIVERATHVDRVRRFRNAHQFSIALQDYLDQTPSPS